jgi:hypothetical protein
MTETHAASSCPGFKPPGLCSLCGDERRWHTNPADRHTANTITDDDLDKLYARIAELEHQAAIDTQVMEKADRECDEHIDAGRKFKAWGEEQHARAERAEAAIARVGETATAWEQMPRDRYVYIHEAARSVRAALEEPGETT